VIERQEIDPRARLPVDRRVREERHQIVLWVGEPLPEWRSPPQVEVLSKMSACSAGRSLASGGPSFAWAGRTGHLPYHCEVAAGGLSGLQFLDAPPPGDLSGRPSRNCDRDSRITGVLSGGRLCEGGWLHRHPVTIEGAKAAG